MTQTDSYKFDSEHRDPAQELERLRAQTLLSWEREARLLTWLGLRDGMHILELGSGPGFVTEKLLKLLPNSQITCLDSDAEMVQRATVYLKDKSDGRVTFHHASVLEMGLLTNTYDFAIARYLFQHLNQPVQAAKETWHVLKTGGKLAIIDIDASLWGIVEPSFPQLQGIYAKSGQANRGGNRRIGRQLWRILQEAGYHQPELEAFVYHSDAQGLEPFLPQMAPDRLLRAVTLQQITPQEFALAHTLYRQFCESPSAYVLMIGLIACGEKREEHAEQTQI